MSNQKSHLLLQVGCLLPYELHLLGRFVFHVLQMCGYARKGLGFSLFLSIPSLLGEKQGWWALGRKLLSISFTVLTTLKTRGTVLVAESGRFHIGVLVWTFAPTQSCAAS